MGSVPHLYTTGDNDPEVEPVQEYRYYRYCDACGSFNLELDEVRKFWWKPREVVGLRCRYCGAVYAHGTPFFKDLGANPRNFTLADVPRPLGSSFYERGPAPAES